MTATKPTNGHAAVAAPRVHPRDNESELLSRVVEATDRQRYSLDEVKYIAEAVAKSDMYGLSPSQAFVLMELAEAEGLHPIQAVRRYHIVEGKPAMRADAMQAEFQRRGGRVRWLQSDDKVCEAEFTHAAYHPEPFDVRVTLEELMRSEVAMTWPRARKGEQVDYSKGKVLKDTYKKYPRQMLRARAISEGVRAVDPGVVVGIYTPEEVSDFDPPRDAREVRTAPHPRPEPPPPARPQPEPRPTDDAPMPALGDFGIWLQDQIDQTENGWKMACVSYKVEHQPLGHKGKPLSIWQVCNGVVQGWIDAKMFTRSQVEDKGKWIQRRAFDAVKAEWDDEHDPTSRDDTIADVQKYLAGKMQAAAQAAGINLDAEPTDEPTPTPDQA